jgi:hypothetical protein
MCLSGRLDSRPSTNSVAALAFTQILRGWLCCCGRMQPSCQGSWTKHVGGLCNGCCRLAVWLCLAGCVFTNSLEKPAFPFSFLGHCRVLADKSSGPAIIDSRLGKRSLPQSQQASMSAQMMTSARKAWVKLHGLAGDPSCKAESRSACHTCPAQMMTSAIYGHNLAPAALADEKGNVVMVRHCASPQWLERLLRPVGFRQSA